MWVCCEGVLCGCAVWMCCGCEVVSQVIFHFRLSMEVKDSGMGINGGTMLAHVLSMSIGFDQHRIVSVEKLVGRFPHYLSEEEEEDVEGRKRFKGQLVREDNFIV